MRVLDITDLRIDYLGRVGRRSVRGNVLDGVTLGIDDGEVVGLVGESGCGKSTLGWSVLRLLPRTARIISGEILVEGRNVLAMSESELNAKVRGMSVSMVIQNAQLALNPVFSVGTQISDLLRFHSDRGAMAWRSRWRSRSTRQHTTCELLERMGIADAEKRMREYPFQFSGGMKQRVLLAMAFITNPRLLIADEPTTALDVTVEAQIIRLLEGVAREFRTAILYITHDLGVVYELAARVAVMYAGNIVEVGSTRDVLQQPLHPYTKGLLMCLPGAKTSATKRLPVIGGMVPSIFDYPSGCRFGPRCPYNRDICTTQKPVLSSSTADPGHSTACWLADQEGVAL